MHSLSAVRPWTPLDYQPQFWIRGDLGVTGSPVSAWGDQSTKGRHATQGTVGNQPAAPTADADFAGKKTLLFDSTDIMGTTGGPSLDLSAAWTIVAVSRFDTLYNFNGIFRFSTGESTGATGVDGVVAYASAGGSFAVTSPNNSTWFKSVGGTVAANTSYVWIAECSGTSASVWAERGTISGGTITWANAINPGVNASGTFAMPASSGIYAFPGGGFTGAGSRTQGRIAEQIAWGRVLTTAERNQLKKYMLRYAA